MSKDHPQMFKDRKTCPTCSHRPESFFADGTVCPTCGRRESLFMKAFGVQEPTQKVKQLQAHAEAYPFPAEVTAMREQIKVLEAENEACKEMIRLFVSIPNMTNEQLTELQQNAKIAMEKTSLTQGETK